MKEKRLCIKCGKPHYGKNLCKNCYYKKYSKKPEFIEKHRIYQNNYRRKNKERLNKENKERYHLDKEFREKRIEYTTKYRNSPKYQKRMLQKKLGNTKIVKEICKGYGFSKKVCDAIALDGKVLENEMKKRGIF